MTLLRAARVVTATAVHAPGQIEWHDGRITAVGPAAPTLPGGSASQTSAGGPADIDLPNASVVPGFVDMHVHGGGGGSYTDADAASVVLARRTHLAHGTTTTMASLVAASPARLRAQVGLLADLVDDDVVQGIHLEGPWISLDRCGAHDPAQLRDPDPAELARLLAAGRGAVRMVTIAPELPSAIDAVRRIVDAGAVAAIGHTDASYEQVRTAIEAGARVATHLGNAMRPVHQREPGPIVALLADAGVTLELIADGTHLHPAFARLIADAHPGRVALVTDAMAAAGLGDGDYRLGELAVAVRGGVARIAGTSDGPGAIAGSTTTMDHLFRTALLRDGDDVDAVPDARWLAAVHQSATTPARTIGWTAVGDLAPGMRADFVVLDESVRVTQVVRGGDVCTKRSRR